jgi:CRP-like cAMP-binding protein
MFDQLASYLARYGPLSDRDFRAFVSALQRRRVRRKQNLIAPGEAGGFDMFVESGCLRIYSMMRDGAERILDFGTENTWWCGSVLSGAYPLQNIGIDAVERTDVLIIDSSNKERLCGLVPDVERMFRFLAQSNLATLQQRLVLSLQNTAEARYEAFRRIHPHLEGRIPGYSVASYLGISPEFFSKLRNRRMRRRSS